MSRMTSENYLVEKERGDDLTSCGDLLGAIEAYDLAINYRPQFWGAYYMKGDALLKLERFHEAAVAFNSAALYSRGRVEPLLMAGRALFGAEFYTDACFVFGAIDPDKFDADSALQYAICLLKCKRPDSAINLREKFILSENKSAVRLLLADAFRLMHEFDEAQRYITDEILNSGEHHANLHIAAQINFAKGDIELAFEVIVRAISLIVADVYNGKLSFAEKAQSYMSVREANSVLRDVCSVLDANNIQYFLDGGTLLGIMRDGDLLPYDKDVDIGIFPNTPPESIYSLFDNREGYICKRPKNAYEEKQHYWNIVVENVNKSIIIDFFYFHKTDGFLSNGFYNPHQPIIWRRSSFEMTKYTHQGINFTVPQDHTKYLSEMYGVEWMVPDPFFQSVVSAKNLDPRCLDVSRVFGLLKIYDAISHGNFSKAKSIFEQVQRLALGDTFSFSRLSLELEEAVKFL